MHLWSLPFKRSTQLHMHQNVLSQKIHNQNDNIEEKIQDKETSEQKEKKKTKNGTQNDQEK